MDDRNACKTDEKYSLLDFCFENDIVMVATYRVCETIEQLEGMVSGFHPEVDMVSIKAISEGRNYCIPIRSIEKIIMIGTYDLVRE